MASVSSTTSSPFTSSGVSSVLSRKLIFVSGKGGVGKTLVSRSIADALATQKKRKVLWVVIEDPLLPPGELKALKPGLWRLNCEAGQAFEEYVGMKIGVSALTRIFLQNKLMRYLSKAAPGIHEIVLLGKIWHERDSYDQIVVDMPSTGYGLAMFQSIENFSRLFQGGPIHRDAQAMFQTFSDPKTTGHLIVALPEEMPLQESLELQEYLQKLFPENAPAFLVNRRFPAIDDPSGQSQTPDQWTSPVPTSARDYIFKRSFLERHNMRLWEERKIPFGELRYVPPPAEHAAETIVQELSGEIVEKGYL